MSKLFGAARAAAVSIAALVVWAQGCSSAGETRTANVTDTDAAVTDAPAGLALALALARPDVTLDRFLKDSLGGFERGGSFLASRGFRGVGAGPSRIAARLGSRADLAFHVGLGPDVDHAIALSRDGASSSEVTLHDGRALYAEAYPSTDLIAVSSTERYEELLLLRDARAPSRFSFRYTLPSSMPMVSDQPDGALLFRDASGQPAIRMDKPYALDSRGQRRDATAKVQGDRIVIELDPKGLEFPVLLDPAFDVAVWTLVSSSSPPGGRYGHAMTFHAATNVVLMNGGYDGFGYVNDSWTFNGTSWSSTTTGPSARRYAAMAYDAARSETVLFGGFNTTSAQGLNDTWVYAAGTWTQKCIVGTNCVGGTEAPTVRFGHTMAYDSGLGRVLLFGGNAAGVGDNNEIWEWNGATAKWAKRCTGGCVPPLARTQHGMAYDANAARMVVYGGTGVAAPAGLRQDTQLYNSATDSWSNPAPATSPGYLQQHSMTYDSVRKRVLLFGGRDVSNVAHNETWQWNGSNWSQIAISASTTCLAGAGAPYSGPCTRSSTPIVFDPVRKNTVTFSGIITGSLAPYPAETHTLTVRGDQCSAGTTCDTGLCTDGVCCTAASCGTCQRCDTGTLAASGVCTPVLGADDPDTCTGTSTCDGSGVCKKKNGQPCSAGSECSSGACIDNTCCGDTSCGSVACRSCANATGTCTTVVANADDGPCTGANTCNAAGVCKKKSGQGCSAGTECASANCVDDTCCTTTCTTPCRSCANAAGTCTTLVSNQEDGTACNGINSCDASGNCKKKTGQGCSAGTECVTGNCVDSYCCDTACSGGCDACSAAAGASQNGTCTVLSAGAAGQCSPYKCGGTAVCPTTCSSDGNCAAGYYCSGNACLPKKALGASCSNTNECTSTYCADGVCCNTTCTGKCMACDAANKQSGTSSGTCDAAKQGTNPGNQCILSSDPCGDQASCSGTPGECAKAPNGKSCGPTTCQNGAVSGKVCNGSGLCVDQTDAQCAPYVCKGSACSSPCTADTDCQTDYYCATGVCVAKSNNGAGCSAANSCKSGFCVDAVCCDAPCAGQCQACAELGSLGQCKVVTGDPRSPRPACQGAGADPCKGACDGANPTACTYPASGTACKSASCTGDVSQPAGTCDGVGLCAVPTTKNCLPYGCNAATGSCNATCASDGDCAQGAKCDTTQGKCAVTTATCSDAFTVLLPNGQSQSCSPYKCVGGACQQQCGSSNDCATGYTCQGTACVADEAGSDSGVGGTGGQGGSSTGGNSTGGSSTGGSSTGGKKSDSGGDDGGCGCRVPSSGGGTSAAWLGALALAALRRRRARGVRPARPAVPSGRGRALLAGE